MIGELKLECFIYEASSLKDKRSVLQRIKMRIKGQFNIAIAETGFQDLWQRSELTLVSVADHRQVVEKELNRGLKLIDSFPEIEATVIAYEWY